MLSILSALGVAQSMILSIVFFKKRELSVHNHYLSGLFLLLALAMLLISLSVVLVPNLAHLLEIFEFSLTLSAGPVLYMMATTLLRKNVSRLNIFIHFVPAIGFLIVSLAGLVDAGWVWGFQGIPIMVPVIHMQIYTLWLCWILMTSYRNRASGLIKEFKWLVMITALLMSIHFAQWIRFFFSDVEWLKLIVPATAFVSVYILTFYGFLDSGLFLKTTPDRSSYFEKDEEKKQIKALLRIMDEKKVYQDPELTLDEFSRIAGLPSYKVSHLINNGLGVGFNEWINRHRVEKVKDLLNDPAKSHFTIEAIAEEAGFKSRSVFYNVFKKEMGMTPAHFRNQTKL